VRVAIVGLQDRRRLSVTVFVPIDSVDSNINGSRRCLDRWPARQSSRRPSAEHELETPLQWPRHAANPLFPSLQTAGANVNRQANGSRIGDALSYTSQRRRTARKPKPIILFFLIHPPPPNQSHTRC
jgi:hypothetical protein